MKETDSSSEVWKTASKDLNIEVVAPFDLKIENNQYRFIALIQHFGSPHGTLVLPLETDRDIVKRSQQCGYFVSRIKTDLYHPYRRDKFIDTLNDWGYCGPESKRPKWYTGKLWTP